MPIVAVLVVQLLSAILYLSVQLTVVLVWAGVLLVLRHRRKRQAQAMNEEARHDHS